MAQAGIETTRELVRRVQCEFFEMPGLRVTVAQARWLWGIDDLTCRATSKRLWTRVSCARRLTGLLSGPTTPPEH